MKRAPVSLLSAQRLLDEVASAKRVLDIGSGGRRLAAHVLCVDVVCRRNVDVVADLCGRLPFPDETFDLVVCTSVLEHVADSAAALRELHRVTRGGGRLWLEVPFLYHYHVSSTGDRCDFRRWTWEGLRRDLEQWAIVEHGHNVGPGTALRLMAAEVLAMPLHAEAHTGAYHIARWFWGWALYPLSWLDKWCIRKSVATRATGGFWVLACKS